MDIVKKMLLAVSLTLIYMLIILIINIIFPNSDTNTRFFLIGISATFYLIIAQKLNKKLFAIKA